jgi:hypothetical protein
VGGPEAGLGQPGRGFWGWGTQARLPYSGVRDTGWMELSDGRRPGSVWTRDALGLRHTGHGV